MTDFEYMKEALATELVMMLIEKEGMDMKSALNCFYNSDTFSKLSKPESGLYFQSEGYVYALLHKEITTGNFGWCSPLYPGFKEILHVEESSIMYDNFGLILHYESSKRTRIIETWNILYILNQ